MKIWIEIDSHEKNHQVVTLFMENKGKTKNCSLLLDASDQTRYYNHLADFLGMALTTILTQFEIEEGEGDYKKRSGETNKNEWHYAPSTLKLMEEFQKAFPT